MKKYQVEIHILRRSWVTVKANSSKEAKKLAKSFHKHEYDQTIDEEIIKVLGCEVV